MSYSVLMSVYYKEKGEFLRAAMESMFAQTVPTDDFVLICDGELTEELNAVIAEMSGKYPKILNVVRLPENKGLGNALNIGLKHCKNELVARMDSDDIAVLNRCELQLEMFEKNPDISIVGGWVDEFVENPDIVCSRRIVPENTAEIIKFSKMRNPFNHPTVMYRKTSIESVGGYKDFYLLEDYYLWLRVLINSCQCYNLQAVLVKMRVGAGMYSRRGGVKYVKSQIRLLNYMKSEKYIGFYRYVKGCLIRVTGSLVPTSMRKMMFQRYLRN